jgi:predicted TIM-barrel enzyme
VHGAIVGTVLHEAGDLARPLDGACVREVVSAFARA